MKILFLAAGFLFSQAQTLRVHSEQLSEFQKVAKSYFSVFDGNGDGEISQDELTEIQSAEVFAQYDGNNDGEITSDQFYQGTTKEQLKKNQEQIEKQDVQEFFQIMDLNGNGSISKSEASQVFNLINSIQEDQEGTLNQNDFLQWVQEAAKDHRQQ